LRERKRKWECFGSKVRAFLHPNNNTHQETTPKPQKEVESTLKPQKWAFSWTLRVFYEGKQKWSQRKEEEVLTTPWLSQTTLKGEEKGILWSPIPNLKFLGFGSVFEKKKEEKRKRPIVNVNLNCEAYGRVYDPYNSPFHTQTFSEHTHPLTYIKAHLLKPKLTKHTKTYARHHHVNNYFISTTSFKFNYTC